MRDLDQSLEDTEASDIRPIRSTDVANHASAQVTYLELLSSWMTGAGAHPTLDGHASRSTSLRGGTHVGWPGADQHVSGSVIRRAARGPYVPRSVVGWADLE